MDQLPTSPERQAFTLRELVDMIIDQLAEDNDSLKRCSLVSRQWVPRCRYHLLKVISFVDSLPGKSLGRWCATFGAYNPAVAGLARELHFRQEKRLWIHPTNLERYTSYLSHFTNVTTLVFVGLATSHATSLKNCFEPFAANVRTLRLRYPITRPASLMQTILLFPAAANIQISFPQWSAVDEHTTFHPPLREEIGFTGALYLCGFGEKWSEFFTLLSARRLRFEKIRLIACELNTSVPAQALLEAVSQSTSTIHLAGIGKQRIFSNITLHTFNALEGFAFKMTDDGIGGTKLAQLLDSISSLRLSLLALDVSDRDKRRADRGDTQTERFFGEMKALDWPMYRLANRALQGTGKRFTLILLANSPNPVAASFTEFQKVGNIWKGEKSIKDGGYSYSWTFMAAKGCEESRTNADDSVLNFVRV